MKIAIRLIAVLLLLTVALGGLVWFLFDGEQIRPKVEKQLSSLIDRPVSIGELELSLLGGQLVARQIAIDDDPAFSADPFISAAELELSVEWWPLLSERSLRIRSLRLQQPVVALRQDGQGRWNFASLGNGDDAPAAAEGEASADGSAVSIDQLRIDQGQMVLTLSDGRERAYQGLQLAATEMDPERAFPFELSAGSPGGGTLAISGEFGPWHAGAATETPLRASLSLAKLDLASSGLVGVDAAVAGLVDFEGSVESANESLNMSGQVRASQLRLIAGAEPLSVPLVVDYVASYELRRRRGELSKGSLGTGAGGIQLAGDFVQTPEGLFLDLRATANELAVDDVQAMLPAFGIRLPEDARLQGGTLGLGMALKGTLDSLEVAGPVQLADTTMVGFSLGDQLSVALSFAGVRAPGQTQISRADLILRSNPAGMLLSDLNANIVDLGQISGGGRVAADGALDLQLKLVLDEGVAASSSALGSGGARILGFAASSGVGIKVSGNLDQPQFAPDQSTVANAVISGLLGSRRDSAREDSQPQPEDVVGSLFQSLRRDKEDD